MKIDIVTFIPGLFDSLNKGKIGRAINLKKLSMKIHNFHSFAVDKRGSVDDKPFGGGPGMILKVDVADKIIKKLKRKNSKVILLSPRGKVFNQKMAQRFSKMQHLIILCGRYEGYDERVYSLVDEAISIGDYILTGGEIPAMVILDATVRLLPGVVDKKESLENESFSPMKIGKLKIENCLEYPQYTRPQIYKKMKVPKILLSGNHLEIANWKKNEAQKITKEKRPDLFNN